jgi:predicted secreted hydrolase
MKFHHILIMTGLLALASPALSRDSVPLFTGDGYPVPQPGRELPFPRSHAAHPAFKIEWWYLTGHLFSEDGRRFGYQATFFRSALRPPDRQSPADFGSSQLYLTHMALTDARSGSFHYDQRLARDGWDAYARTNRLEVRNGNWMLEQSDPAVTGMRLTASIRSEVTWELDLIPSKPVVRFGADGTSRKGPAPEARSYYLSFTRLQAEGTLSIGGETLAVTGSSWMDHEIASNQLDENLTGWDWIAIQLKDGWEVKAYLLRREDGSPSPFSALIWIDPQGKPVYRTKEAFSWESRRLWESPHTGGTYPVAPVIRTTRPDTGQPVTFRFSPLMDDQELVFPGTNYWEGAGRVLDADGQQVGDAYLELVGYAGQIEGLR